MNSPGVSDEDRKRALKAIEDEAKAKAAREIKRDAALPTLIRVVLVVAAVAVLAAGASAWFALSASGDSHDAKNDTTQTRTIVVSVVCGMTPTPAGCPKGSKPTASAQSQQAIVDQIINGPKVVAKQECVASAAQLAIANPGVPADILDDPCDAIK